MKCLLFVLLVSSSQIIPQNHLKELNELYASGRFDETISKAKELLFSDSTNSELNLIVGRSFVDKRNFVEGQFYLLKVCADSLCPKWMSAWAMNYLGRIEFFKDNLSKSKVYINKSIILNATKNVTNSSKNLLKILALDSLYSEFEIVETDNIRFYFQPNSLIEQKENFCKLREEALKTLKEYFETELPKKIDFIVWNSNEDAIEVGINQLGFARPEFCVIHSRTNQTIGHELTHVITFYLAANLVKTRFINEGIAVCFDQSNNDRPKIMQEQKVKESPMITFSIKDAWNNPNIYPEWVYYPLAGEFIKRILDKWGKEKLVRLLKNQTYENALLIYGEELIETISEFENEIN